MAHGEKRGEEENTKIWISQERKELFSFWKAIIWWKIKNWQKIADTSFNVSVGCTSKFLPFQ